MNVKAAIDLIKDCKRGMKIAGRYFDAPYTQQQIVDAAIAILDNANLDAPTPEQMKELRYEVTLANRRYAATNAQLSKITKERDRLRDGNTQAIVESGDLRVE